MGKLIFVAVVLVCLYFIFRENQPKTTTQPDSISREITAPKTDKAETSGLGATQWGDGHQAGYDWAQEKGIDDEGECEEAGDHSNSPSFAEGCSAYVQEQQ